MNYLICKQLRNIVYMEVLNTALYYTKVCLGFSSKHEKVDIPNLIIALVLLIQSIKVYNLQRENLKLWRKIAKQDKHISELMKTMSNQ